MYVKLPAMIKKLSSLSHKTWFIILVLLVAVGAIAYFRGSDGKTAKAEYPQYYNFAGNYVFSVPKTYSVDEQSVPGAQLVYSGAIEAKTVEDVYNNKGIAVQGIADLTDHSGKGFKKYVNETFVPDLKKNLSTNDIKIKFGKANGGDNVSITANKDGKTIRFIYLKGGQHPAQVVAKEQSSPVKKITETITDLEKSAIKDEAAPIKQAVQNIAQLAKDQKPAELHSSAAKELRDKNSQTELTNALKTASPYTNGNITISGGSYAPNEFSAAIRFVKLDKNDQLPAFGSMSLKKIDGQWKLQALSLPTPKQ